MLADMYMLHICVEVMPYCTMFHTQYQLSAVPLAVCSVHTPLATCFWTLLLASYVFLLLIFTRAVVLLGV